MTHLNAIDQKTVELIQSSGSSEELIQLVAKTFQALADTTRLKILYALVTSEVCVRDLAILVEVSESAISHQLRLLRDRRLVLQRREGNVIYYSLNDRHLAILFREAEYHADHIYRGIADHTYL